MNNRGQILFVTLFISIIILSLTLSISTKFLHKLNNISVTAYNDKALFVAESLAEILLVRDTDELITFAKNQNCSNDCILQKEDDSIAFANINLIGDSPLLDIYLNKNIYQFINLKEFKNDTLKVCFSDKSSIVVNYFYKESSEYKITDYYISPFDLYDNDTNFNNPTYDSEYGNCFIIDTIGDPEFLQIKSLYNNTKVKIISNEAFHIPYNGVIIDIIGKYYEKEVKLTLYKYLNSPLNELNYSLINYDNKVPLLKPNY